MVGFLTGFVAVLCVGNYYRAKRAMERQRERRMARLSGTGAGSPSHSSTSSQLSDEHIQHQSLLRQQQQQQRRRNQQQRGRPMDEGTDSLLLDIDDRKPTARVTAV